MAISNVVTFRGLKKSLNTNNHNNSDFGVFFFCLFYFFFLCFINLYNSRWKKKHETFIFPNFLLFVFIIVKA